MLYLFGSKPWYVTEFLLPASAHLDYYNMVENETLSPVTEIPE